MLRPANRFDGFINGTEDLTPELLSQFKLGPTFWKHYQNDDQDAWPQLTAADWPEAPLEPHYLRAPYITTPKKKALG